MLTLTTGAGLRAILVGVLVATPSLLSVETNADAAQVTALLTLFAAALTFSEYTARYPSLVEFRDAPPFNRIRFIALFLTVFTLSVMSRNAADASGLTVFIEAFGMLVGHALDVPYSPVSLVLASLPEGAPETLRAEVRSAAGMAYLIACLATALFYLILRLFNWPTGAGAFNVWINLPTFDPTAGRDVVDRLNRDAWINASLGIFLPFIIPVFGQVASALFGPIFLDGPEKLIWTVAIWAFLPMSLVMRGVAMARVAKMIVDMRRRAAASATPPLAPFTV